MKEKIIGSDHIIIIRLIIDLITLLYDWCLILIIYQDPFEIKKNRIWDLLEAVSK